MAMTLSVFSARSQCELPKSNSSPSRRMPKVGFSRDVGKCFSEQGMPCPFLGCLLCLLLKIRVHHFPCVYTILQRQVVKSFDKHWVLNLYNTVQAEEELPSLGNFLPKLRMVLYSQQMCLVIKQPPSPIF